MSPDQCRVPVLKIRWSHNHLIFVMEKSPYLERRSWYWNKVLLFRCHLHSKPHHLPCLLSTWRKMATSHSTSPRFMMQNMYSSVGYHSKQNNLCYAANAVLLVQNGGIKFHKYFRNDSHFSIDLSFSETCSSGASRCSYSHVNLGGVALLKKIWLRYMCLIMHTRIS